MIICYWFQDTATHRVDLNEDTDATVDEDDERSIDSCTDVKEEQQTQLDILKSLDDPQKCTSKIVYVLLFVKKNKKNKNKKKKNIFN